MYPEIITILTLGVVTTVSGQYTAVEILDCASMQLEDGKTVRSVGRADLSKRLSDTCSLNAFTRLSWIIYTNDGVAKETFCSIPITGCNTVEAADGCACVSRTGDFLTVSVRWTFNKTKHTGSNLDLVPDCLPDAVYLSRTKCTNLQEYNACAGVNCGLGKCVAVDYVPTCNCSGIFRTGKHCEVLPCSKKDCGGSKCGLKAKGSEIGHEAVCMMDQIVVTGKKRCSVGQCDKDCCSVVYPWLVGAIVFFGFLVEAYWTIGRRYPTYSPPVHDALARQTKKLQDMKEEENPSRYKPSTSQNYEETSDSKASPDTSDVDSSIVNDETSDYKDEYKDPKHQTKYK